MMDPVSQRREKLRQLEQSLFGVQENNVIGLPTVKDVNEYHVRYGSYDTQNLKQEPTSSQATSNVVFRPEPRKRVRLETSSVKELESDESSIGSTPRLPPPTAPPLSRAATSRSRSSTAASRGTSARRSQQIIDEELENLTSKLTTHVDIKPNPKLKRRSNAEFRPTETQDDSEDSPVVKVKGRSSALPRARLVPMSKTAALLEEEQRMFVNSTRKSSSVGKLSQSQHPPLKERKLDTTELLRQEQDELELSLSAEKFKALKNAKIERIKAEDRLDENQELVLVKEKESSGPSQSNRTKKVDLQPLTFRDMPSGIYEDLPNNLYDDIPRNVYDKMPDTFHDIPKNIFDDIPRALTARTSRHRKPSVTEEDSSRGHTSSSGQPSAPDSADRQGLDQGKEIGFIAMLFQGGPVSTVGNTSGMTQIESDYMFALFIQNHEAGINQGQHPTTEQEREIGHFCAPLCPGFCQANQCIFHADRDT